MNYKATVHISGAMDQHIYGRDPEKLKVRATKLLTTHEPGFGSLWPLDFVIREQVQVLSGNRSEWRTISVTPYKDIPEDQQEWRSRKARHLAERQAKCDHKFIDSKSCLKCGWTPPPVKYPCPKHPDVLRDHPMQICLKCEAEIDAAIMPTINDER